MDTRPHRRRLQYRVWPVLIGLFAFSRPAGAGPRFFSTTQVYTSGEKIVLSVKVDNEAELQKLEAKIYLKGSSRSAGEFIRHTFDSQRFVPDPKKGKGYYTATITAPTRTSDPEIKVAIKMTQINGVTTEYVAGESDFPSISFSGIPLDTSPPKLLGFKKSSLAPSEMKYDYDFNEPMKSLSCGLTGIDVNRWIDDEHPIGDWEGTCAGNHCSIDLKDLNGYSKMRVKCFGVDLAGNTVWLDDRTITRVKEASTATNSVSKAGEDRSFPDIGKSVQVSRCGSGDVTISFPSSGAGGPESATVEFVNVYGTELGRTPGPFRISCANGTCSGSLKLPEVIESKNNAMMIIEVVGKTGRRKRFVYEFNATSTHKIYAFDGTKTDKEKCSLVQIEPIRTGTSAAPGAFKKVVPGL